MSEYGRAVAVVNLKVGYILELILCIEKDTKSNGHNSFWDIIYFKSMNHESLITKITLD